MGGKHKQAQRIKNNARPSSSGRSAELLASTSQIPQFSSVKEIRFVPPTLSLMKTEGFDTSVSPAFQIVFKKMNKKDCTTKIKALQEFSELISSSEAEAVKTILAFWATLYGMLVTDTDHRVREAVHNAHYQIVLKDKKMIAPYLKQLIGPWFTSQYDSYPPAASAAAKAFAAAFPPNKVQDCVIFCQKEILTYIYDNLTSKLETSKNANDDSEAKFERIIIASLQGYCLYLDTLTNEQIEKCTDLNKQIITNSRFLKLANHKTALIRATWFKVLSTLYHNAPILLSEEHSHVVPAIFNNLDESEPAAVGFVWESAFLIMELGQDWWKHIHLEKTYLSKLKKVLREGGQGNASVIYPNLLTLLHKLPPSLKVDQFYDTFFENLRLGLKRRSVLSSKSESTAVVTALVECLQYVILVNKQNSDLCEKLIKSHLLPLVDWSLKVEQVCYRTVFHQVTLLVQYWNRNKSMENYTQYLELFWTNLVTVFESASNYEEDLSDRQVTFMQHLKHVAKPKEQMKVKFSEATEVGDSGHVMAIQIDESYTGKIVLLAYTVIRCYVRQIEEKKLKFLLQNLFSLIRMFESREFLTGLGRNLTDSDDLLDVYKKFYEWLKSTDLRSEIVVDLAFVILRYVSDDDKDFVLKSFLEFSDNEVLAWCVKNSFSHPLNQDGAVQKWLKNPRVSDFLVATTDANLTNDCPANLQNIVRLAFTEDENGEFLIDKSTIFRIIEKVQTPLLRPEDFSLCIDSCAHLASYITDTIYTESSLLKCGDSLLLALFEFSCTDPTDLEFLTDDTQWEIDTSWQDVVTMLAKNLPKTELMSLVEKFAQLVESHFLGKFTVDSATNRLIKTVVDLIKAIFGGQPLIITDVFRVIFDRQILEPWLGKIEELCLVAEYLSGSLANCEGGSKKKFEIVEEDILRYFVWGLMKVTVLSSPLVSRNEDEDDEEEEDVEGEIKEVVFAVDDHKSLIINILYDVVIAQSFLHYYRKYKYFSSMEQNYDLIKSKTKDLIELLQVDDEIKQALVTHSNEGSFLWNKIIYWYNQEMSNDREQTYIEYNKLITKDLSQLHLTQLYGPYISFDHIDFKPSVFDSVVTLRTLLHCDDIDVQIAEVFEKIKRLRNQDPPRFVLDNKDTNWADMETIIEVIRLFSRLFSEKFECLSRQHWDLGVICLSSWAANCYKLRAGFENVQTQALFVAVSDFYISLNEKMASLKSGNVKNAFVEEWEDLFLPEIHSDLLQLWLFLADQFVSKSTLSVDYHPFVQEFGRISDFFFHKLIFNKENNLPNWTKILRRCTKLLTNSSDILQLWGYKMLVMLLPGLIDIDLQSDSSTNTKGFTVEQLKETLQEIQNIVDGVLAGFKLGEDSCQVIPFTDSYTYVFAYLLLWSVLLNLCEKSPPELRYQYAEWLRNENYFKNLLNNLFKLMPTEILHYSEGKAKAFMKLFLEEPTLTFREPCTSEKLEHAVCWIYAFCLSQLPALVRQWWSETETKVTQIVERVTSYYVSPQLCNQELQDVGHRENNFKNMTIKIIPSVREVIAIYTVDEAQMELVITLPHNYPLGGPDVRCSRQIGGPLHKQWLMQLKKYLLHQNGRIWDGLALWNGSLDKKFDGVEECYICFAVLHPATYQLPKLSCQTCKKKFHSACLYKWFSTSNKSSCPICRNLF